MPSKTNNTIEHVINAPRFAGDKKPKQANANVTNVIQNTCAPDPSKTDKSIPLRGGRNTSPWTNFQPNSSCASSPHSIWLYRAMSLWSVRSIIIATIPDKNSTMTNELRMLNHWMLIRKEKKSSKYFWQTMSPVSYYLPCVRHWFENVVPTWWPLDCIILHKCYCVRVYNVKLFIRSKWFCRNSQWFKWIAIWLFWISMVYWHGLRTDWYDSSTIGSKANAPVFSDSAVIRYREIDVIEWIVITGLVVFTADWTTFKLKKRCEKFDSINIK